MPKIVIKQFDGTLEPLEKDDVGFSTTKFKIFKTIVNLIGETAGEVNFEMSPEGLSISCMDSSHVSYLICELPKDFFEEFQVEKNQTYGVNMISLMKIFSISRIDIGLTIKFLDDSIMFFIKSDHLDKTYNIKQMDIDTEPLAIPDMDWEYNITINSRSLYDVLHEVGEVSDSCEMKIKNSMIQFGAEGPIGSLKIKIEPEDIEVNSTDKYLKLALSTKYLQNFVKARNICGNTSMSISKDAPIKMTYDIGDGGFIHSYIAPKIY